MSDSAEYKAFKDCHDSLFTCIKQSPKDVSDRLEILAPADRDYLRNDSHDDGDKARRIIDAVLLQIENNPLVFQSFISALEAAGSFTKTTVPKLNDALIIQRQNQEQCDQTTKIEESDNGGQAGEELQPTSVSTSSSGFESLTASDFNTDRKFFSFQCGCGKCTILGHVTGRDKCLSSKPPQIKRITRDTACSENRISATEISYKKFMTALRDETRRIHSKFCSLLTNTITNLENQYDITKVKQYVQALLTPRESYYSPMYRRPSEQILFRDVTSFRDLSVFLQNNFCSWFNYSLISVMREEFLFPYENDQALLRYEHLFRQYVNRRCFLFVDDFGPQPSHIESVEITCMIDDDFQIITNDQIKELELVFMNFWEQELHQVLNLKFTYLKNSNYSTEDSSVTEHLQRGIQQGNPPSKVKVPADSLVETPDYSNILPPRAVAMSEHLLTRTIEQEGSFSRQSTKCLQFYDKLSFIKPVDKFEITSAGGMYHNDSLGLSIEAPEGIIPQGSVLPIKIGMCLHGPFKFSNDCTPIAPILMIHPPEDVCLLKPLKITLPLILTKPNDSDVKALGIQVVKAEHATNNCTFKELDESCTNLKLHSQNGFGYATFSISHFCFISVRANNNSEVIKRSGYCIYPLYSNPSTGVTYHLCVTYFTEPCITAIEQQFPKDEYELKTADIRRFTFRGSEPYIEASIKTVGSESQATLQSANPATGAYAIKAESIDLWRKDIEELELEIRTLIYPPSFRVHANHQATGIGMSFVTVEFKTNQIESDNFYMTLIQPLPSDSDSTSASPRAEGDSRLRNISEAQLDRKIGQCDVPYLAGYFDDVELYLDCCGLTPGEQTTVNEKKHSSGNHVAMIKCLTIWRTTNPKAATFRALLEIVLGLQKGETARQIRQYLRAPSLKLLHIRDIGTLI